MIRLNLILLLTLTGCSHPHPPPKENNHLTQITEAIEKIQVLDRNASIDESEAQINERLCLIQEIYSKVNTPLNTTTPELNTQLEKLNNTRTEAEIRLLQIQKTGSLYRKPPRFYSRTP